MKSVISALALVVALTAPGEAQARNESQAAAAAAALIFVPTYCPGWGVDMNRFRQMLATTGVAFEELQTSPMREKVKAVGDYLANGDEDKRIICQGLLQVGGPTGFGIFYPR